MFNSKSLKYTVFIRIGRDAFFARTGYPQPIDNAGYPDIKVEEKCHHKFLDTIQLGAVSISVHTSIPYVLLSICNIDKFVNNLLL